MKLVLLQDVYLLFFYPEFDERLKLIVMTCPSEGTPNIPLLISFHFNYTGMRTCYGLLQTSVSLSHYEENVLNEIYKPHLILWFDLKGIFFMNAQRTQNLSQK